MSKNKFGYATITASGSGAFTSGYVSGSSAYGYGLSPSQKDSEWWKKTKQDFIDKHLSNPYCKPEYFDAFSKWLFEKIIEEEMKVHLDNVQATVLNIDDTIPGTNQKLDI